MSDNQACLNWMTYGLCLPKEIGKMIRELCKWKEVNLIEGEARRQGD